MNSKSNAKIFITIGIILILVVGFVAYKNVTKVQNYKKITQTMINHHNIDRNKFNEQKRKYWENEWDSGRWKNGK